MGVFLEYLQLLLPHHKVLFTIYGPLQRHLKPKHIRMEFVYLNPERESIMQKKKSSSHV